MRLVPVLLLPLVLTACGYKGALYLPDQCEQRCSAPEPAPATPATQTTQP